MKNYVKMIVVFAALGVIFGAATTGFAQIKTGGYKKVSVNDPGVVAAADFAIEAQGEKANAGIELLSIVQAERQTVAGTNYKLCMEVNVADGEIDEPYDQFVTAIIFFSLQKEYSLKSWMPTANCGED